jgi:hypothetical protein
MWGGTAAAGDGADTFYFGTGFGHDTIEDFNFANDVLNFDVGLGSISYIAVGPNDTLFYDGAGDSVLLVGVHIADAASVIVASAAAPSDQPDYIT